MLYYDAIIDEIIEAEGGASGEAEAQKAPALNLNIIDNDGDEIAKDLYVVEDGEFKKLSLKELRRKKCEWTMKGAVLIITGCRLTFKEILDAFGEVEAWDCHAQAWDHKKKRWEEFEDDFAKNFAEKFGVSEEDGKKMEDLLMQRNDPESGKQFDLTFYLPTMF